MSISSLYELLRLKEEQLERLITCQGELTTTKSEFTSNEYLCLEPVLTEQTWNGTLAAEFDDIRESGVLLQYQDIENVQFPATMDALSEKIKKIKQEIIDIKAAIAAAEAAARAASAATAVPK